MIGSPGGVARTIGLRVRKNAKPGTSEGLAYIIVKMLAVPLHERTPTWLKSGFFHTICSIRQVRETSLDTVYCIFLK